MIYKISGNVRVDCNNEDVIKIQEKILEIWKNRYYIQANRFVNSGILNIEYPYLLSRINLYNGCIVHTTRHANIEEINNKIFRDHYANLVITQSDAVDFLESLALVWNFS